jgi:putative hemolysin
VAKQKTKKTKGNPLLIVSCILLTLACIVGVIFIAKHFFIKQQPLTQTYTGTLPCADCSGLITTLTLIRQMPNATSGKYVLHELYDGKTTQPFISEGLWKISQGAPSDPSANVLTLSGQGGNTYYLMKGETQLEMLDANKHTIDSPFNETLTLQDAISSQKQSKQLANPASVNCTKKGGNLVIKTRGDGGEYGVCEFENNQACEEWAMYRGDCPVGGVKTTGFDNIEQQYCAWVGGQTLAVANAVCNLPSGNVCSDKALYNGTCQAN